MRLTNRSTQYAIRNTKTMNLDLLYKQFNNPAFIASDPISVPHLYLKREDIEIAALFASIFAWGQRITIINKAKEILSLMDNAPYDFIMHHKEKDLKSFEHFKHRTFNATDALYFIEFLKNVYRQNFTLEEAFILKDLFNEAIRIKTKTNIEPYLNNFRENFFSLNDYPHRTKKHISSPAQHSTCKRLCMFLRWMVRKDKQGVDFGIWKNIKSSELICPIDIHVERIAREFNLISRKQLDWLTAVELTENLKKYDAKDPVKYDFALFGYGVNRLHNKI